MPSHEGCRLPLNNRAPPGRTGWPKFNGDDLPPSLQPHYRAFITTTRQSAPLRRIGTFGLAVVAACAFSLGIAGQVLTFRTRACLSFAPPTRRMPLGQHSGQPPNSSREKGQPPVLTSSNPISTLHRRFACARLSQPCLPGSSSRRFRNAAGSAGGISPPAAHRSGLDTLASSGSCHRLKAAAFRRETEFLLSPVDSLPTSVTRPLRSTGITPFHH